MRILSLILIFLLCPVTADAAAWRRMAPLKLQCGNYCPVVETKGKLVAVDNSSGRGDMRVSRNRGGVTSGFSRLPTVSRSKLRSYRIKNTKGLTVDWLRTAALAERHGTIYALLHMGTGYPARGGYIPVAAISKDQGRSWKLRGAIKIDGKPRYIFSSSMAYTIVGGTHYMVQDAGAYGHGKLVMFRSSDGLNWKRHSGDIARITRDRAPAWPSMTYHGGRFHLVFTPNWRDSRVRHLSSRDGRRWQVESKSAARASKGCNLFVSRANLYCHSKPAGRLWSIASNGKASSGSNSRAPEKSSSVASGAACSDIKASVKRRQIALQWQAGRNCVLKIRGPRDKRYKVMNVRNISKKTLNVRTAGAYRIIMRDTAARRDYRKTVRVR